MPSKGSKKTANSKPPSSKHSPLAPTRPRTRRSTRRLQSDEPVPGVRRSRRLEKHAMESSPPQTGRPSSFKASAASGWEVPSPWTKQEASEWDEARVGGGTSTADYADPSETIWHNVVRGVPRGTLVLPYELCWSVVLKEVNPLSSWGYEETYQTMRWIKVESVVEYFAHEQMAAYRPADFNLSNLKPETKAELARWTPNFDAYLDGRRPLSHLISALIWHTLDEMVFSASFAERWQHDGPTWAHYSALRDTLRKSFGTSWTPSRYNATYQLWTHLSDLLVQDACGGRDRIMRHETSAITARLLSRTQELLGLSDIELREAEESLSGIAGDALIFDQHCRESPNKFWIAWGPTPAHADSGGETSVTDEVRLPQPDVDNGGEQPLFGFPASTRTKCWFADRPLVGMLPFPRTNMWLSPDAIKTDRYSIEGQTVDLVASPALMKHAVSSYSQAYKCIFPMCVSVDCDPGKEGPGENEPVQSQSEIEMGA